MKKSPLTVGFLQSAGVIIYVTLFANAVTFFQDVKGPMAGDSQPGGIIFFLLLFVFSALVCSSLVLGYPIVRFFEGKHQEAIQTIVSSAAWLLTFGIVFGAILAF